jgi:hypothetical protein
LAATYSRLPSRCVCGGTAEWNQRRREKSGRNRSPRYFVGVTGAIVTRTNHLLRSQGAATNTEIRPRRQLGHGVVNAARRISLKHPKTTGKHALVSPPSQTRDLKVWHDKPWRYQPWLPHRCAQNACVAAHRSYQNLLRPPSRSTDSPSPHDFIVIWYKLEPSHVLSQDTLPHSLPISRVLSSAVIPRSEHRFYTAVGLLLLLHYTVVTAHDCVRQ